MAKHHYKNKIRIISGFWKNRKIIFPETFLLRPTTDRIRETLFNWLSPYIKNAKCLDLFSGSGILSFEALSRGAKSALLIDQQKQIAEYIKKNIETLQAKNINIITNDVMLWLNKCDKKFDIIFIDPPYSESHFILASLKKILERNLLEKNAVIYFESNKKFDIFDNMNNMKNLDKLLDNSKSLSKSNLLNKQNLQNKPNLPDELKNNSFSSTNEKESSQKQKFHQKNNQNEKHIKTDDSLINENLICLKSKKAGNVFYYLLQKIN